MALGEPDVAGKGDAWFLYGSVYNQGGMGVMVGTPGGVGGVAAWRAHYRRLSLRFDQAGLALDPNFESRPCTVWGAGFAANSSSGGGTSESQSCLDLSGSHLLGTEPAQYLEASIAPLAAQVGVTYSHQVRTTTIARPPWRVDVGTASVNRLNAAFAAMFSQTAELPDWPPWRETEARMDGVIEVDWSVVMAGDRRDSGDRFSVSAGFHACLYRPDGNLVKCWAPSGRHSYRPGLAEFVDVKERLRQLADAAIQEAASALVTEVTGDPEFKSWAASIRAPHPRSD
jgi:hypothetical protein